MGHWFKEAGFRTFFVGKWHLSEEDLPGPEGKLKTVDRKGVRQEGGRAAYARAAVLRKYGFEDNAWIGPEPHGAAVENTGTVRDPIIAEEAIEILNAMEREREEAERDSDSEEPPPFLLVISLVNPHDVCIAPFLLSTLGGLAIDDPSVPPLQPPPTIDEDPSNLPSAYRESIGQVKKLMFDANLPQYYRTYLWFHVLVDRQIGRIMDALEACPRVNASTALVLTSDHGDLAGAHGGAIQKWYNAYDEVLHVPLVISLPGPKATADVRELPTSHVDLLPTMLALCNVNVAAVADRLRRSRRFEAVPTPVGWDFSAVALDPSKAAAEEARAAAGAYFSSEDDITLMQGGLSMVGHYVPVVRLVTRAQLDAVRGARHVEAVVARAPDGRVWKAVHFYENVEHWTSPAECDEFVLLEGAKRGTRVTVTRPAPDEWQVFCLSGDPCEVINLHPAPGEEFGEGEEELARLVGWLKVALAKAHARCVRAPPRPHAPLPYREHTLSPPLGAPPLVTAA
eukprot:CAMPEP_0114621060 /NCGR_PEP_ID=MMETSP0168-20121206/9040_1 /TAXON_ID=95228 ORGANISM="Vannella sp., Strain DIVA3 517/6/12" /NCGR_SAMPLE_ID=MMETSP0168 /ASSEMBLY_ACC=CAM_ASM_000044 /LENGTH=510 /DNA_ID=CAMNT_0001832259 /DNA_START=392 /DNA_END=1920 /DNA_ORIENTATION=-